MKARIIGSIFIAMALWTQSWAKVINPPLTGQYSKETGPNCWNYALYLVGVSGGIRSSEEKEFTGFIKSPLCRQLSVTERPIKGDLFAIWSHEDSVAKVLHAYVAWGGGRFASKNGPYSNSPFSIYTEQELFDIPDYHVQSECRFPNTSKNCRRFSQAFRCQTPMEFLNRNAAQLNGKVLKFWRDLKFFENHLGEFLLGKTQLQLEIWRNLIAEWSDFEKFHTRLTATDRIVLKLVSLQMESLEGQFYYTHGSPVMDEFRGLKKRIEVRLQSKKTK